MANCEFTAGTLEATALLCAQGFDKSSYLSWGCHLYT
jgi:hypothetical protein